MSTFDLSSMVEKTVRINRSGPESIVGKLLSVKPDHLVLYSEGGVIYIKTEHIKSMSLDSKDYSDLTPLPDDYVPPQFFDMKDFVSVLGQMESRWVQINRGGPDKVEGILTGSSNEMTALVAGNEMIHVMNFHIRSISYAQPKQEDSKEGENKESKEKDNKQGAQNEAKN